MNSNKSYIIIKKNSNKKSILLKNRIYFHYIKTNLNNNVKKNYLIFIKLYSKIIFFKKLLIFFIINLKN
jgi:hypothetical protein